MSARTTRRYGACWALPAIIASCTSADRASPFIVRDSAGVRIAESTRGIWADRAGWSVDPTPALSIGVVEGDQAYQFSRIADVRRFSDGRIVVANQGSDEVRIYDQNGRWVRTLGRRGDGPGEFRGLLSIFPLAQDSLVAVSHFGARYTVFSPALEPVRVEYAPMSLPGGRFDDGAFLNARYAQLVSPATQGHVRDTLVYIAYRPRHFADPAQASAMQSYNPELANSWPMDTLARVGGNDEYRSQLGSGMANEGAAFGRRVVQAVHGLELFTGDGAAFEVRAYGRSGGLGRILRLLEPATPLSRANIEEWSTQRRSRARNEMQREHAERVIAAMTFPAQLPAFRNLIASTDGFIWTERYPLREHDSPRWAIFQPDGRYLGTLETPARFRVVEIGTDYLLGVWTDASDVEYVRSYHLRR